VKALSFVGKSTLVNSVLQSIPVYLMSSSWIPKSLLEKADAYCRRFLWSKDAETQGTSLMTWDVVCRRRADQGFGFRQMPPFQEALMGKQLAKLYISPPSLWAKVIKHKYMPLRDVWDL